MQFCSNNHWPALSSILDEHQIESRDSLETNKLATENTQKQDLQIIVHDLRTNQNSTKHTLTKTNDLNTKKELKEIRISEQNTKQGQHLQS